VHRLTATLLLLALAACSRPAPPAAPALFRDTAVPVYSNAVFEEGRIVGQWQQVAAFAAADAPDCGAGQMRISGRAGALAHEADLCLSGRRVQSSGGLPITGPGRLTPARAGAPLDQQWWVLWVDTGYRTLVIGAPSGDFGFVLNRDGALPADRLVAAKEVLDFNGYDVARLRVFGN
jgi:apolipoprotein D and lipocalin family protein